MIAVSDKLPDLMGFYWIKTGDSKEWELAYFVRYTEGHRWQDPYTVGDSEGLSVEYFTDVTHWAELEPPSG